MQLKMICIKVFIGLLSGLVTTSFVYARDAVGDLRSVTGTVSVHNSEQKPRVGLRGMKVFAGDVVVTEEDSTVLIVFIDSSQVALKAKSRFGIQEFNFTPDNPKQDTSKLSLIKGGMRTITGLVGKRGDPDAYQVQTKAGTIGIRGTDYVARYCENDCPRNAVDEEPSQPVPLARVVDVTGSGTAKTFIRNPFRSAQKPPERNLIAGAPLYAGETLQTDAGVTEVKIVTQSGTRLVVPGSSRIFFSESGEPNARTLTMVITSGGLRVASASTSTDARNANTERVRVETSLATLEGQNIQFDLLCDETCTQGFDVQALQGELLADTPAGLIPVKPGKRMYVSENYQPKQYTPPATALLPLSSPDQFSDSVGNLEQKYAPDSLQGLYVNVIDGVVRLEQGGKSLLVHKGEGALMQPGGQGPERLPVPLRSVSRDPGFAGRVFLPGTCTTP